MCKTTSYYSTNRALDIDFRFHDCLFLTCVIWHDGSVFGLGLVDVALLAAEAEDGPLVVRSRRPQRVDRVGARGLSEGGKMNVKEISRVASISAQMISL